MGTVESAAFEHYLTTAKRFYREVQRLRAMYETILDGSRFVRACLRRPVDRTPVWFLRQAGRYMQEYRDVRKHHTLVEICKQPEIAAEVTITAAEKLGVDAAIIFADLLLPLEPMGLPFEFQAGEGPVSIIPSAPPKTSRPAHRPRRRSGLRGPRHPESRRPLPRPPRHHRLLRRAVHPGQLHDRGRRLAQLHPHQADDVRDTLTWRCCWTRSSPFSKSTAACRCQAGADVIQIFDSWVGALSASPTIATTPLKPPSASSAPFRPWACPSSTSALKPPACSQRWRRPAPMSSASTGVSRSTKAGAPSATATPCRAISTPSPSSRPLEVLERASKRFCAPPTAVPATSSTSATASSPPRRSKTCRPSKWSAIPVRESLGGDQTDKRTIILSEAYWSRRTCFLGCLMDKPKAFLPRGRNA
jgi:hypothetical protein